MRPVRITGVTGTSVPVPLDVYSTASKTLAYFGGSGTPGLEFTIDNVFDSSVVPKWFPLAVDATLGVFVLPQGTRAVRGTGMAPDDTLVISEQGLR